jgi:nucleotide-binding universal stress UspA family protein
MKKILVAIDGSEPSNRAALLAAELASKVGARLTLAHVMSPLWIPPETYNLNITAVMEAHAKEAQKLIQNAEKLIRSSDLVIDRIVLDGFPADALADHAKDEGYDLVVVGSRGQSAISRVLLGSFSNRLAHICEVPLLIVR